MSFYELTTTPEWNAISLESKLTMQLCSSGLTDIGRANYAEGKGYYYTALFALSIGIERLCKLVICFDVYEDNLVFPSQKDFRAYGHKINDLLAKVEEIRNRRGVRSYSLPRRPISGAIISQLDEFADAGRGRYANFMRLTDSAAVQYEPVRGWYKNVGLEILRLHFEGSSKQEKAEAWAYALQGTVGESSLVRHTHESGDPIETIGEASFRSAENKVMQKYGRFYSFEIVRYVSSVFKELSRERGYQDGGRLWFGHYEHFNTFTVQDSYGLNRKRWPLR